MDTENKEDINVRIGRNLKQLRREARLSQPEIAELLDVTFQQVQKYEKGVNRLPIAHLHRLKTYLDIPYESFFAGVAQGATRPDMPPDFWFKHRLALVEDPAMLTRIKRVVTVLTE